MKIEFNHRINWLTRNLAATNLKGCQAYRYAGALEICLQEVGAIPLDKLPEYKSFGKCYVPYILDFTAKESYPAMILRVAKEYINNWE